MYTRALILVNGSYLEKHKIEKKYFSAKFIEAPSSYC